MKKSLLFSGLSFICFLALSGNLSGQGFYDIDQVNTIEIEFSQSNWDYLLDSLVSDNQDKRLFGKVIINGQVFDSAGVRYKGNSSYSADRKKNPLNIKLDYIIDNQLIEGYGTIKLANGFKDPSFVRETLSYEIARKYLPASQSNYANLYINGNYLGLYTCNQDVDKYFMRIHFSSDDNACIKGEISGAAGPGSMGGVWEYFGADSLDYQSKYKLESDFGWRDLISFLDTLNNFTTEVEKVLNVDHHLWFLAFQNLLVNLDGPINNPQNYYLYKDDAGQFNPIPWDLNESFGVFVMLQSSGRPLNTAQLKQFDPFVNMNDSSYPVISKILSNDRYRRMYVAHMKTIIDENLSNSWYRDRALELQDIIDADVQADPNKFYSYSDFINNIDSGVKSGAQMGREIIGISELMDARISWLSGLDEFSATTPEINDLTFNPQPAIRDSEIHFSVVINNANHVFLNYRYSVSKQFESVEMFDDGSHADEEAGDNVYGVTGVLASSDIQYYIYAENNNAGIFLPAHAENEYYTIPVLTELVINEFMANNEETVADQDGEYDDWLELYNNTESDINLGGYYLSDDGADLQKWTFPDTLIKAKDFLIVWIDKDEEQVGLHANFKLSASGETIYFLKSSVELINEITFDVQSSDTSMGRYPNGTGEFAKMNPTFSSVNNEPVADINTLVHAVAAEFYLQQNYPNPFNPVTTIRYSLPDKGYLKLVVYDVLGCKVKTLVDGLNEKGSHQVQWDGKNSEGNNVAGGIYIYQIISGNFTESKKMILLR